MASWAALLAGPGWGEQAAGQAGLRPEERSGGLGRGLLGQKEEGARLVMLGPDLAFLFPIFYLLNKPRASMWGPVKGWQFTGIKLIKIVG